MAWDPFGMQSEHRERKTGGSTTVRFFLDGPGNLRFLTGIQEIASNGTPSAVRREIDVRNQAGEILRRWIVNG